jgi:predicted enzyme related to lactoylglutathione lyase
MPNRPVHFEIQADDPERAIAFYTDVFGWKISKWESEEMEYWMIETAEKGSAELGINGGLQRRPAPAPGEGQGTNAWVTTMAVEDYDAIEKKILDAGGKVALPKFALAGMAWQGYYLDTEGNTFGIHQPDENAK